MPILKKPLKVKCLRCQGLVIVKFGQKSRDYSKKNNWNYWTGREEEKKHEYMCDDCLLELYYRYKKEFRTYIPNKRRQRTLQMYIHEGLIGGKRPFFLPE